MLYSSGRFMYLNWVAISLGCLMTGSSSANGDGAIGKLMEDGRPVIFKFVDEMPPAETRTRYPWLTVISWPYDGNANNGMPLQSTNSAMLQLEAVLEALEARRLSRHAYSRTGNNLKEFVFYIQDRDQFMDALNEALRTHPRYPIDITFYSDTAWEDHQKTLNTFRRGG